MTEIEWANLKAHELRRLAEQDAIVVLPIAALEQHGPHLPVQVDSRLAGEVSRRAARIVATKEPIVVLPVIWHGLSEHHVPFGGTMTLDYDTFYRVLRCLVRALVQQGFRRICILNGHGGNIAGAKVAVADLTTEFRVLIVTTSYWSEAAIAFGQILERQKNVLHACEAETSMMMVLTPDLVDRSALAKLKGPDGQGLSEISAGGAYRWFSFAERTHNGVIGDPATASPTKGEKLLAAAAEGVARMLLNPELWAKPVDLRAAKTGGVALKAPKRNGRKVPYKPAPSKRSGRAAKGSPSSRAIL